MGAAPAPWDACGMNPSLLHLHHAKAVRADQARRRRERRR
jgi:hypothetical protein